MAAKSLDAGSIWTALSKIDCTGKTMDKGGLTYLPWNQAVTYMMDHYPDYTVKWHGTTDENNVTRDVTYYEGGTAMVNCTVTIGEVKRECWLPVMDYKNKAIAHPSSRDISDSKQRCLVKCFALFGLGIYIYRGDAVPEEATPVTPVTSVTPPKKKAKKVAVAAPEEESPSKEEVASTLKTMCKDLHNSGWTPDVSLQKEIKAAVADLDLEKMNSLIELLDESGEIAKKLNDDTTQELSNE
tara:strand:+ start:185 stop:907 length:723 start_codon:yes stop_codon:yes gene_type:complete